MAAAAATAIGGAAIGKGISGGISYGFGQLAAGKQFSRQKQILKNRYQWQVADLKAAGLNPILAVSQPPPAPAVPIGGFPGGGEDLVSSAKGLAKLSPEMKILRSNVKIAENEVQRTFNAAGTEGERWNLVANQALHEFVNMSLDRSRMPAALAQEKMDKTDFGQWMRYLNRTIRGVTGRDSTSAR